MSETMNTETETESTPETTPEVSTPEQPNREAAKYRTRLREAEAETEALRSQVEAMRRAEVERLAAAHMVNPSALWAAGTALPDLLDEGGNIVPAKVSEAARAAVTALGLAAPRPGNVVPREGTNPGSSTRSSSGWTKAFSAGD